MKAFILNFHRRDRSGSQTAHAAALIMIGVFVAEAASFSPPGSTYK
jgi:hypothetical protein